MMKDGYSLDYISNAIQVLASMTPEWAMHDASFKIRSINQEKKDELWKIAVNTPENLIANKISSRTYEYLEKILKKNEEEIIRYQFVDEATGSFNL